MDYDRPVIVTRVHRGLIQSSKLLKHGRNSFIANYDLVLFKWQTMTRLVYFNEADTLATLFERKFGDDTFTGFQAEPAVIS